MTVRPRLAWVMLAVIVGVGGAWRGWIALTDEGIYWPDEIYQSFEPAHRLVFDYGIVVHEFRDGLRTWALPGFIATLLIIARSVGLTEPLQYVHFVKVVFAAISVATIWGIYLLARVYGASRFVAATASAFFAFAAPAVYLGPRALSENASALPVVLGLACVLSRDASPLRLTAGGFLLGLAVILRLQTALICVGLMLVFVIERRIRALLATGVALGVCALALGLLDKLTWGGWFHSAISHLEFNLLEGRALEWGSQPATYYLVVLWTSTGPLAALAGLTALAAVHRAWPLWLITACFVGAHSLTPHKEFRFILPALPLLASLCGIGLQELARVRRPLAYSAAALLLGLAAGQPQRLEGMTMRQIGRYGPSEERRVLDGPEHKINRLLAAAGRQKDLCGVHVQQVHWSSTGGYTYLHRPVPLYDRGARDSTRFNYVIAPWDSVPSADLVASERQIVLVRTRPTCAPDPGYSYQR